MAAIPAAYARPLPWPSRPNRDSAPGQAVSPPGPRSSSRPAGSASRRSDASASSVADSAVVRPGPETSAASRPSRPPLPSRPPGRHGQGPGDRGHQVVPLGREPRPAPHQRASGRHGGYRVALPDSPEQEREPGRALGVDRGGQPHLYQRQPGRRGPGRGGRGQRGAGRCPQSPGRCGWPPRDERPPLGPRAEELGPSGPRPGGRRGSRRSGGSQGRSGRGRPGRGSRGRGRAAPGSRTRRPGRRRWGGGGPRGW